MNIKQKIISIPPSKVTQIAQSKGISRTMVYNALAFRSNSPMAEVIRKESLELYGGVVHTRLIVR